MRGGLSSGGPRAWVRYPYSTGSRYPCQGTSSRAVVPAVEPQEFPRLRRRDQHRADLSCVPLQVVHLRTVATVLTRRLSLAQKQAETRIDAVHRAMVQARVHVGGASRCGDCLNAPATVCVRRVWSVHSVSAQWLMPLSCACTHLPYTGAHVVSALQYRGRQPSGTARHGQLGGPAQ